MIQLLHGDCLDVLKTLPDNSVDSVITDPPYGLKFMSKHWDYNIPTVEMWRECLRVLKPGAYLLSFAGTRTQHRMACNIEDAGFEIRDMIAWVYGSGMPKHQSSLKPALEPITLARKPAPKATLLNIDACRVEGRERTEYGLTNSVRSQGNTFGKPSVSADFDSSKGRYPSNLIHDGSDEVLELFPQSNGAGPSLPQVKITGYGDGAVGTGKSEYLGGDRIPFNNGSGSAARFFYCAKTSKKDREEGLDEFEEKKMGFSNGARTHVEGYDKGQSIGLNRIISRKNSHPTVKPTDLMRYLCRLVTPVDGVVLDPFMGSGSTGKAAVLEGFQFIGIEREVDYLQIASARVYNAANVPDFLRPIVGAGDTAQKEQQ
jgi:DNA modification methylase